MANPAQSGDEQSRRLVYFAAERTLSSWVRTALSLMALGFVIDRFSLVVQKVFGHAVAIDARSQELSHGGGSFLIALGVLMAVVAGLYHLRFAQRYRRSGSTRVGYSLTVAALFTLVLGACGVALLVAVAWVL